MSDPNAFNVAQLKEFLRARGLSATGTKAELITRLHEADPSGEWVSSQNLSSIHRDDSDVGENNANSMYQREIEICRREKEIAERELELARREIALLRECRDMSSADHGRQERTISVGDSSASASLHPRLNLTAVADLLASFDSSGDFDAWEKQARLLKTTYQLDDDYMKVLIGTRLKKKALEWFHSKPEFISMTFDTLILELRVMFGHRQSRITTRRKFEERTWKRGETFHEYVHEKIIMGNRVPIGADKILEYLIDGIPDGCVIRHIFNALQK